MEHKLITGGFQYLPYARSRIKAMRAAGLNYGSESFTFPDATGFVRISGEHAFIRIEGGGQQISMDSGVIDLASSFAGRRADTTSTANYLDGYALGAEGGQWEAWRSKPGGPLAGQVIGTVSFPPLAGHIRDDLTRAPSFEPAAENGGRLPVTMTAAVFLVLRLPSRTLTPWRSSIASRLCLVIGALRRLSPVPFRPTTMP